MKFKVKNTNNVKNLQFIRFELHFYTRNMYYFNIAVIRPRSREPFSAVTYGNSQQRISRLALIIGT